MCKFTINPIGVVHSALTTRGQAPKQGHEGAPEAWVEIFPAFREGIGGLAAGAMGAVGYALLSGRLKEA